MFLDYAHDQKRPSPITDLIYILSGFKIYFFSENSDDDVIENESSGEESRNVTKIQDTVVLKNLKEIIQERWVPSVF